MVKRWEFHFVYADERSRPGSLLCSIKILIPTSNQKFWEEHIPGYDTDRIENGASCSSYVACVFVGAVMSLPSRLLATIGGTHTHTHRLMGGIYEVRRSKVDRHAQTHGVEIA
jgi:hypothetical protein